MHQWSPIVSSNCGERRSIKVVIVPHVHIPMIVHESVVFCQKKKSFNELGILLPFSSLYVILIFLGFNKIMIYHFIEKIVLTL